jgi:HEAT repeat protein
MRKVILSTLLATLAFAAPACKEPDPNKFETHIERIKVAEKRSSGFTGLEKLTRTIVSARDNDDLIEEFAQKVIPVFEEVWDDAKEQHETMLTLLRDVGHPAGTPIWTRALALDGSSDARKETILALDGIKKANAVDAAPAIIEELDKIITEPKNDKGGEQEGQIRAQMAETLGRLGSAKAVPVLVKAMEQTREKQPVRVHREAAEALGRIGDPSAVDALLTVTFRVPDAPTTTSIGERSKLALVRIGEPAVPKLLQMLRGEHEDVNKLAAEHGLGLIVVQQTAAGILGAIGHPSAVDQLIAFMPKETCKDPNAEAGEEDGSLRAVISNALGNIGDPKAADVLCSCMMTTDNPGDLFPIIEALGRVGGDKAVDCLVDLVKKGAYDADLVEKEFKYQPRWEAGRFAVLLAKPDDLGKVREAFAGNTDPDVKEHLTHWEPGLALLDECKSDRACYEKTLADVNADWFAREKAAYEVARQGDGDQKAAVAIAQAFKVRDADARVTMAWLSAKLLPGQKCPECVTAIRGVLEAEKLTMDAKYQLSVLTARATIAKLDQASGTSAAATGDAE